MQQLKQINIYRGGVTAAVAHLETHLCVLSIKKSEPFNGTTEAALSLHFELKSKGGGKTWVAIRIGQKDFATILDVMMEIGIKK